MVSLSQSIDAFVHALGYDNIQFFSNINGSEDFSADFVVSTSSEYLTHL